MTSLSTRFFGHPRLMNPIFICGGWGRTLRFGSARNFPAEAAWHGSAGRPCFDFIRGLDTKAPKGTQVCGFGATHGPTADFAGPAARMPANTPTLACTASA